MSLDSLFIHEVTVFNTIDSTQESRYGDPELTWEVTGTVSRARVQLRKTVEHLDGRDTVVTSYQVFLPGDSNIGPLSYIEWEGRRLRVVGEPAVHYDFDGVPHHVEVGCQGVDD